MVMYNDRKLHGETDCLDESQQAQTRPRAFTAEIHVLLLASAPGSVHGLSKASGLRKR